MKDFQGFVNCYNEMKKDLSLNDITKWVNTLDDTEDGYKLILSLRKLCDNIERSIVFKSIVEEDSIVEDEEYLDNLGSGDE